MKGEPILISSRSKAETPANSVALFEDFQGMDIGPTRRIPHRRPSIEGWNLWFEAPSASVDFADKREQPATQARETL